ncbi:M56 family metallopeptidase [Zavarzinella formosa]|uniref:M56 family metallopeptidase n=1 Tax=Zavarzinella formosa TaxID=360055 RepID=UPI0002FD48F1|nr:M56 family metallopeptidase [Zavarzinella formosa]
MNTLLWWLAANTVTVAVMIPVVMAGCRLFRHRPAVQHLLWVIVLVKLITPPLVSLPWPTASLERVAEPVPLPQPTTTIEEMPLPRIDSSRLPESLPKSLPTEVVATAFPVIEAKPVERTNDGPLATRLLFVLWVSGGLVWLAMQARRIARHRRIVRMASPAPDYLRAEVRTVADHLDAPLPPVLVSDMIASPFVWCVGRPRLVWPTTMADPADIESSRGVIAHELAHLCRRDHWVSWLELAAGAVWWWNPLFRFARRRMRESAEMACDALALLALPGHRRGYAELLLRLSAGCPSGEPAPVLGVGARSHSSFERRLSMILSDRVTGTVSGRGLLLVTAMAMALAALPGWSPAQAPKTPPAAEPVNKAISPPAAIPAKSATPAAPKTDPPAPPTPAPEIFPSSTNRRAPSDNIRVDLSALDLGERYLKADADLKIAAQKLKNVIALAKDKVVSNQEVQLYEIEMARAERTLKLMQSFLNVELSNAEQALESQAKQFQLVSEGYKKGIIPQAELLQVRAKMEECEARLRLIKVVADMAGK